VVLFEALAGVRPFEAPTLEALAIRMTAGTATPIESIRPDLPAALAEVVRRAIDPDRAQRLPSARALVDALGPFREGRATSERLGRMGPFEATLAAGAPAVAEPTASARSDVASPSGVITGPTGLPRRRRALVPLAAAGAIGVTGAAWLLVSTARVPASVSSPAGSALLLRSAALPPAPLGTASLAPTVEAGHETLAPPAESGSSSPRKAAVAKDSVNPPQPAPPPVHSASARSLGLSHENPFR
jgi:serine/threonine-protein kinase